MVPDGAGALYELTVVGQLGPVLRAMLAPAVAATSCAYLTIILRPDQDGPDLVDVVELLSARGIEAVAVSAIH
jgi:hypothetical protein